MLASGGSPLFWLLGPVRKFLFVSAIIASPFVIIVLAAFAYLNFGSTLVVVTSKPKELFHTEADFADSLNSSISTKNSFSTIPADEEIAILYDTFGKDYWACYVRSSAGIRGWTECSW